jgi:ribosomal protein L28
VRKAFTARVRVKSKQLRNVKVLLDRRPIAQRNSKSFRVRVSTSGLRHSGHLLTARARDASRRSGRATVKFRVCR